MPVVTTQKRRNKHGYPLAEHDPTTLFGGNEKGLVDYPAYHAG